MKIYLDLLPEEKKEEIRRKKIFLKTIRQEILFTIPIFSLIVILLMVTIVLETKLNSLNDQLASVVSKSEYEELKEYEDEFSQINLITTDIFKIQKDSFNWFGILKKLSNVIPDDVYLSDLETNDYRIALVGKAKTRDNFLKLEENIKSENCFSNINVPLSNLASKENVEFQINFEVKEDCLKNKIQ